MDSLVNMEVCRVCLAIGAKMHHMSKHKLIAMFERVVGVEINAEDILPKMLCWECAARLLSAYNFVDKAFKTHWILVTKLVNRQIVTMSDIESIDKSHYKLESTLGIKVSKETDSNVYIINENDKGNDHYNIENHINDGGSVPESCELIDISIKDKHIIITEANVSDDEDPPNSEYLEGIIEQNVADKNYKEANVSGANNNIKFQNKNSVIQTLEQETTTDNVSNVSEMSKEKNPILDEAIEVCEKIKQSRKRKHDSVTGQRNRSSEGVLHGKRKKKLREVSVDKILRSAKPNIKDSFKKLTAQPSKDSRVATPSQIKKEILEQINKYEKTSKKETEILEQINKYEKTSKKETEILEQINKYEKTSKKETKILEQINKYEKTSKKETTGTADSNIRLLQEDSIFSKNAFICDVCDKEFDIKNTLIQHIREHSKVYRRTLQSNKAHLRNKGKDINSMNMDTGFTCDYCGYKSSVKRCLSAHINAVHTKRNLYNCSLCDYKTYYQSSLSKHMNAKHIQNNVYNCSECSYKTSIKKSLSHHIKAKHTKHISYNCSHCDYQTYHSSYLSKHINTKHSNKNIYSCSYCSYETCQKNSLSYHINAKHTETNVYKCSDCTYKTYSKSNLIKHIKAQHKNMSLKCTLCNYKTYHQSALSNHINVNHTKKNVYKCSLCSYKTFYPRNFSEHNNAKHSQKNVYKCSLCSYETYQKRNLSRHTNSKHTKTNVFNCSQCSYTGYYQCDLTRHINAHHTQRITYNCTFCDYKAFHRISLTKHINAHHTQSISYNCSLCSYTTYDKSNYTRHMNAKNQHSKT